MKRALEQSGAFCFGKSQTEKPPWPGGKPDGEISEIVEIINTLDQLILAHEMPNFAAETIRNIEKFNTRTFPNNGNGAEILEG